MLLCQEHLAALAACERLRHLDLLLRHTEGRLEVAAAAQGSSRTGAARGSSFIIGSSAQVKLLPPVVGDRLI